QNRRRSYSTELDEIRFETTPPISPDQLAILVGNGLSAVPGPNQTDPRLQLLTLDHQNLVQWEYSLETAANLLNHYRYYFGVRYPLPKLDLVPLDSATSAASLRSPIEKLGLVLLPRTQLAITNRSLATEEELELVAESLSHS